MSLQFNFSALAAINISPDDVSYLINTHGHSDHIGNNNLFLQAKHIVGQSVSFRDQYELHNFKDPYIIEVGYYLNTRKDILRDVYLLL